MLNFHAFSPQVLTPPFDINPTRKIKDNGVAWYVINITSNNQELRFNTSLTSNTNDPVTAIGIFDSNGNVVSYSLRTDLNNPGTDIIGGFQIGRYYIALVSYEYYDPVFTNGFKVKNNIAKIPVTQNLLLKCVKLDTAFGYYILPIDLNTGLLEQGTGGTVILPPENSELYSTGATATGYNPTPYGQLVIGPEINSGTGSGLAGITSKGGYTALGRFHSNLILGVEFFSRFHNAGDQSNWSITLPSSASGYEYDINVQNLDSTGVLEPVLEIRNPADDSLISSFTLLINTDNQYKVRFSPPYLGEYQIRVSSSSGASGRYKISVIDSPTIPAHLRANMVLNETQASVDINNISLTLG